MFGPPAPGMFEVLLLVAVIVAVVRSSRWFRRMREARWRWTIADWFNVTLWIGIVLGILTFGR